MTEVLPDVVDAVGRIKTAGGQEGSCVLVRRGDVRVLLTAEHVLDRDNGWAWVALAGVVRRVTQSAFKRDVKHDLAGMSVSWRGRALHVAAAVERYEEIAVVSYPGLDPSVPVAVTGLVQGAFSNETLFAGYSDPGSSGGAVADSDGNLVGIVSGSPICDGRKSNAVFYSPTLKQITDFVEGLI